MSIFTTRSRERDQEADIRRLNRLTAVLEDIIGEMTVERDGLDARCRKTKEEAAFSLLALEDGADSRMSERVDLLTKSLILATNRLKSLQDQIAFMGRVLEEATSVARATMFDSTERRKTVDDDPAPAQPESPSSVPRPSRKA